MKLTPEQQEFLDSIYEKNFISVDNIHEEPYKSTAVDNHITLDENVKLGEYEIETTAKPGDYFITLIPKTPVYFLFCCFSVSDCLPTADFSNFLFVFFDFLIILLL